MKILRNCKRVGGELKTQQKSEIRKFREIWRGRGVGRELKTRQKNLKSNWMHESVYKLWGNSPLYSCKLILIYKSLKNKKKKIINLDESGKLDFFKVFLFLARFEPNHKKKREKNFLNFFFFFLFFKAKSNNVFLLSLLHSKIVNFLFFYSNLNSLFL